MGLTETKGWIERLGAAGLVCGGADACEACETWVEPDTCDVCPEKCDPDECEECEVCDEWDMTYPPSAVPRSAYTWTSSNTGASVDSAISPPSLTKAYPTDAAAASAALFKAGTCGALTLREYRNVCSLVGVRDILEVVEE